MCSTTSVFVVTLDWDRGVELVTPTGDGHANSSPVSDFLARNGDGVFSVVMRVDECGRIDGASTAAWRIE